MQDMVTPATYLSTEEGIPNYRYGLHIWTYLGWKAPVYYCRGILGQYIISIPEEKIVIVRTGSKRNPNYTLKKNTKVGSPHFEDNKYKVGHPSDLFDYISIAEKMTNN